MERPQHDSLPTLKADVDTLKRELKQMYQDVKTTCGERREQAPWAPACLGQNVLGGNGGKGVLLVFTEIGLSAALLPLKSAPEPSHVPTAYGSCSRVAAHGSKRMLPRR